MTIQTAVVWIIVAIAAGWFVRHFYRIFKGRPQGCGRSCQECPGSTEPGSAGVCDFPAAPRPSDDADHLNRGNRA